MKTLIVEDDFISRRILSAILSSYGECDIAMDGEEAVEAFRLSIEEKKHYDLICMDIMMPNMDGKEALTRIRGVEKEAGINGSKEVKMIMVTALGDPKTVIDSFYKAGATSYIVKPIDRNKLLEEIRSFGLI